MGFFRKQGQTLSYYFFSPWEASIKVKVSIRVDRMLNWNENGASADSRKASCPSRQLTKHIEFRVGIPGPGEAFCKRQPVDK